MIPKIIHFCWLSSDPYPEKIQQCLDSWQKVMPDYEIRRWSAQNFDLSQNRWCRQAFEQKKYAFAADYIRFYALYHCGGIYLDSDVLAVKSFDPLLAHRSFLGYEYCSIPEAAVLGAEPGTAWLKDCLEFYETHDFADASGKMKMCPVPLLIKKVLEKRCHAKIVDLGTVTEFPGVSLYPYYYFSPKNCYRDQIDLRPESFCIHNFNAAWMKKGLKIKLIVLVHRILYALLGKKKHDQLFYAYWKWPYQ